MKCLVQDLIEGEMIKITDSVKLVLKSINFDLLTENDFMVDIVSDFGEKFADNSDIDTLKDFYYEHTDFWNDWLEVQCDTELETLKFESIIKWYIDDYFRYGISIRERAILVKLYLLYLLKNDNVNEISELLVDLFMDETLMENMFYRPLSCIKELVNCIKNYESI